MNDCGDTMFIVDGKDMPSIICCVDRFDELRYCESRSVAKMAMTIPNVGTRYARGYRSEKEVICNELLSQCISSYFFDDDDQ